MLKDGSSAAEYARTRQGRVEVKQTKSKYDVFLSSRKCDGFSGFAHSLHDRLKAEGIRVFMDDVDLGTSEGLPQLVYSSKICIPLFSRYYAYSARCLDALELMVELTSRSGGKKEIVPVFIHVKRSDVKLETSLYRDALDELEQRLGDEKVNRWKKALVEAGNVTGWEVEPYERGGEITSIVGNICYKLMTKNYYEFQDLSISDNPKLPYRTLELEESQELEIMELWELKVNDVRIVGIHGRDGIGKTALAKIIYDKISLDFDACSFLVDIEETRQQPGGIQYLQTKLIFDILKREYEVASAFKGVRFLKGISRNMKVLIVLDDVERLSILKEFVGAKLDWFGSGSRIIVTSKQRSILQGFVDRGVARTYDVSSMDDNQAFNFFWQYAATGRRDELRSYVEIAIKIVKAAKGLPLLLKVFGSFLCNKGLEEWIEFGDVIKQFPEDYQRILRIIYDALDRHLKEMYLDIACFTPDVDSRIASFMWHRYIYPVSYIEILRHMSLIQLKENKIGMHSMLRCLARKIIREGFHDPGRGVGLYIREGFHDPGTGVELCIPVIAQYRNKGNKKTDHLNTKEASFEIRPKTTFLSLGANVVREFADALSNVRWLHWQGCPQNAISIHLEKNENLVILDLSWSKVTGSWGGWKGIKMKRLKVLNLTGCEDLLATPSSSCYLNLEILILERCSRLVHLDPSINDLMFLVTLNLKFCSELSMLPVEMSGMNSLQELLIDGTSVRELPASIDKLYRLQILSAANCFSLVSVRDSIRQLSDLRVLALDDAKILELPKSIGYSRKLRRLSLRDCRGLGKLPESVDVLKYSLVELDISGTGISKLPSSINYLQRLEVLKMDSCFIREFPHDIGGLTNLEELHASWCRSLEGVIPSDISKLHSLRELRLRGTCILSLPSEIQFMSSLKTLDLLHCDILKELPTLPPNLSKLYVNPDLKQKMLESSKFCRWWHLL